MTIIELFSFLVLGLQCVVTGAVICWLVSSKQTKREKKMYREGRERYEKLTREVLKRNKIDIETFRYMMGEENK